MTILSCPASPSVHGVVVRLPADTAQQRQAKMTPSASQIAESALKIVDADDFDEEDGVNVLLPSLDGEDQPQEEQDREEEPRPPLSELLVVSLSSSSSPEDNLDGDCDSSSVSSVSSAGGDDDDAGSLDQQGLLPYGADAASNSCLRSGAAGRRRSLFNPYWEKNGGPARLTPVPLSVDVPHEGQDRVKTIPPTISPSSRRNIFAQGCWSRSSEPALSLSAFAPSLFIRKIHSEETFRTSSSSSLSLMKQPERSCLRSGKFSSSSSSSPLSAGCATTSCSEDSSSAVTFCQDVRVRVFRRDGDCGAVERWAPAGWSSWFAA